MVWPEHLPAVVPGGRCGRGRIPLVLHQEADDHAGCRQHHRPADPVPERGDRPHEREVLLPGLVGIDRDAARELGEHRRRLGVDVVVEGTEDHGHRPQDHRSPAAQAEHRSAQTRNQEAWVGQCNHKAVEPADGFEELSLLDHCGRHKKPPMNFQSTRKRARKERAVRGSNSIATNRSRVRTRSFRAVLATRRMWTKIPP